MAYGSTWGTVGKVERRGRGTVVSALREAVQIASGSFGRVILRLCRGCSFRWSVMAHQIDCRRGCYRCRPGGQFCRVALLARAMRKQAAVGESRRGLKME